LNDGSYVRLRPERPHHVSSDDFVQDRTPEGRIFRTLSTIDQFTKEASPRLNGPEAENALTIKLNYSMEADDRASCELPIGPKTDVCFGNVMRLDGPDIAIQRWQNNWAELPFC
jgi:hypothetical protein